MSWKCYFCKVVMNGIENARPNPNEETVCMRLLRTVSSWQIRAYQMLRVFRHNMPSNIFWNPDFLKDSRKRALNEENLNKLKLQSIKDKLLKTIENEGLDDELDDIKEDSELGEGDDDQEDYKIER